MFSCRNCICTGLLLLCCAANIAHSLQDEVNTVLSSLTRTVTELAAKEDWRGLAKAMANNSSGSLEEIVFPVLQAYVSSNPQVLRTNSDFTEALWHIFSSSTDVSSDAFQYLQAASPVVISASLEEKIVKEFIESPSREEALLLGICRGAGSLLLLEVCADSETATIATAAKLGLAKRGDKRCTALFVRPLAKWPTAEKSFQKFVDSSAYIGTVDSVINFFDAINYESSTRWNDLHNLEPYQAVWMIMRDYLRKLEITMPEFGKKNDLVKWWQANRDDIKNKMQRMQNNNRLPYLLNFETPNLQRKEADDAPAGLIIE